MASPTKIDEILKRSGEMGRLTREKDWGSTRLGPLDSWPQSLATTVSICLTSRFPIQLWWGPDLVVIYNDAYIPIAGAKHPDLLGKEGSEAFTEIWEIIGPMFHQVMSGGEATWSEDRLLFLDRNGYLEECYFTWSYSPVLSEQGGVAGVFSAVQETTTRILGERRLKTLRELSTETANTRSVDDVAVIAARVLARNSFDLPFSAIYLVDPTNRARLVLAGASGLAAGSGFCPRAVSLAPGPGAGEGLWPFARVLGSGELVHVDDLDRPEGALPCGPWSDLPGSAVCVPITSSDPKNPAGVMIFGISRRKTFDDDYRGFLELAASQMSTAIRTATDYQEERKRAEALAQLDRAKTAFFSNVSHELRTPLTLMLGPVEDILASAGDELNPRWRSDLDLVHRNTQRLLKLVNTLLDFSRIEAGRTQALFEPVDLARFTAELASVFRSAVDRAGLAFTVELDPLPEEIFVDRDMWEKVVLNLLSNAFKFTLSGGITLALRWTGDGVRLQVSDTGIGLPEEEIPRLFERFHRVQGARGRTHEGTGIGLALVQELVRLHGGTITAASVLHAGTTFTVFLPRGSAHLPSERLGTRRLFPDGRSLASVYIDEAKSWLPGEARSDALPPSGPIESSRSINTATTKGALVLLADDNRDMREYVAGLLRRHWSVAVASDGHEALARIRELRPSLVLTDVMMPGLDGFGLLKAIREDPATEALPVIMLSARAGEEARLDGFGAGADDYLIKPFSARELIVRVHAALDMSQSRQAARRVAEEERSRLHALFMQAPAAIAVFRGPDLVYEIANASYQKLVGVHRALIGRTVREALPDLEPRIHAILHQVYVSGQRFSAQDFPYFLDWDSDGKPTTRYLNVIYEPLKGDDGRIEGIMSFAYEVTDQVIARREVERLARAAEAANITKSQFLANMSHEIRTPLGVILGFAELALDPGQSADDQRNYLLGIKRNGTQLLEILGDILDLSKIEANKMEIERVTFSLDGLLDDVEGLLGLRAREKGIGLRFEKDASLPAFIRTDPTRLRQIFVNLVGNAIKFTERGEVSIACQALPRGPDGGAWTLEFVVKDTGIGISPEQRNKLFQPFVQADSSMTRRFGGTGLGLLLSQQLARALDGDLELSGSELGKGSSFRFTIVAEAVEPAQGPSSRAPVTPAPPLAIPIADDRAPLAGMKILLVEDSEDNQTLVSRYLKGAGAVVELADNGLDAVEAAIDGDHDVILMDIQMPILDGHEATARLRQAGYTRPIVALTAHAMRDERERALKGGFDEYLTKPLQRAALIKTLRALKK
jgi:signal transduction histidine kinase/DNA-binding response OmpR family regulator